MHLPPETPNLLQEHSLTHHDKPRKRSRWLSPWMTVFLVVAFVWILPALYAGAMASSGAIKAKQALETLPGYAATLNHQAATAELQKAEQGLGKVKSSFNALITWRYLPWIGKKIQSAESLTDVGIHSLSGIKSLLNVAVEIDSALGTASQASGVINTKKSYQELTRAERSAAIQSLQELLPQLQQAREQIALASESWSSIPESDLIGPIKTVIAPYASRLTEADTALKNAIDILEWALPLAGADAPKTYLLLIQNSDELRPTGGFIGTIGVVKVDAGNLLSFEFEDVYTLDNAVVGRWNEPQPNGLAGNFGNKVWYLRDANWSPDATVSAQTIIDFYQRESQIARGKMPQVDGVVYITPAIFSKLLEITGPITVEGRVFDKDNFFDKLQYDVEQGFLYEGKPDAQRKEIIKEVGNALVYRLLHLRGSEWPKVLQVVTDALNATDVMVYSRQPQTQAILDKRQWSGRVQSTPSDYLWVIDANIRGLKTDGMLDKDVHYELEPHGDEWISKVTLRYRNNAQKETWRYSDYQSYTRVFVPEGSEFVSAYGCTPDIFTDLGKRVFACTWKVRLASSNELVFRYKLPRQIQQQIQSGTYELFAQKQPGAKRELTLDLSFGKKLKTAEPSEDSIEWGDEVYHLIQTWSSHRNYRITF